MEREKQKQADRERELKEQEYIMKQRKLAEKEAFKELDKQDALLPQKSKFVGRT